MCDFKGDELVQLVHEEIAREMALPPRPAGPPPVDVHAQRALLATLMLSQGTPMLTAGADLAKLGRRPR